MNDIEIPDNVIRLTCPGNANYEICRYCEHKNTPVALMSNEEYITPAFIEKNMISNSLTGPFVTGCNLRQQIICIVEDNITKYSLKTYEGADAFHPFNHTN